VSLKHSSTLPVVYMSKKRSDFFGGEGGRLFQPIRSFWKLFK